MFFQDPRFVYCNAQPAKQIYVDFKDKINKNLIFKGNTAFIAWNAFLVLFDLGGVKRKNFPC